jgi:hypothetical protein
MDMRQGVQEVQGKWVDVEFDEIFWFTLKAEQVRAPGCVDLGTEERFSSSFEMTVSQDRPVKIELPGITITIQTTAEDDAK